MSENKPTQAEYAHNGEYDDICSFDNAAWLKWLAYDLSHVPEARRQRVVVRWINNTWAYFEDVIRALRDYAIQANMVPGGGSSPPADGWVTLRSIQGNIYHSRQHIVDLNGAPWIRILITTGTPSTYNSIKIKMDIHDASLGAEDLWLFTGDSLTAHGMQINSDTPDGNLGPNFAEHIHDQTAQVYFPAMENAGRIVEGPDLYDFFMDKPERPARIGSDNLHPNALGYTLFREEWAKKMAQIVYEGNPPLPDTEPPTAPTGLKVAAQDYESITLSWTASADNKGAAGYRIYRDSLPDPVGFSFTTSFRDKGLLADSTHVYRVIAYDWAGNVSQPSSNLTASATKGPRLLPRIKVNGNRFVVGDTNPVTIFMSGANRPWNKHNGTWNNFGGAYDPQWWDDHYRQFNANGLNASRVWITCSGEVGIEIDTLGHVSGATDKHRADLDSFFDIAQNRGVYIMATLMSFDHFSDDYTTYQRWRNWINSDANINSYIDNYMIPFLQRYGDHTALWSIDLINEPDWATDTEAGTIAWSRFQQYFARAAKAIHGHSEVLATVGIGVIKYNSDTTPGSMGNKVSDAALRALLDDPAVRLDFWSPHWYSWMDPYWKQPMYVIPAAFNLEDSKSAVIGECPANGTNGHTLFGDLVASYQNGWSGLLPWTSNRAHKITRRKQAIRIPILIPPTVKKAAGAAADALSAPQARARFGTGCHAFY